MAPRQPVKQYRLVLVRMEREEDAYGHVIHKPVGTAKFYKGTLGYIHRLFNKLMLDGTIESDIDVNIIPAYKRLPWEKPTEQETTPEGGDNEG